MTTRIDGTAYAKTICQQIQSKTEQIKKQHNKVFGLAVVLVGDDPASHIYVKRKTIQTQNVGMHSYQNILPANTTEEQLLTKIAQLNDDERVDGILVQLPLPAHINEAHVIAAIDPLKDVDGFHLNNVGALWSGKPNLVPCTPLACQLVLKEYLKDLRGKHAVIIGRSNIVGKPCAALLLQEHCTVTIAHSRTQDLPAVCQTADILVAAVGKPHFVKDNWVKQHATVIDVGINRITKSDGKTKIVGDVDYDHVQAKTQFITPVPGGIGPMTIACLLVNTLKAAQMRHNIPTV